MNEKQEKEFSELFNHLFNRAQLDAIKATFSEEQKNIYNQVLIAQKETLLQNFQGLSPSKLSDVTDLFDKALL